MRTGDIQRQLEQLRQTLKDTEDDQVDAGDGSVADDLSYDDVAKDDFDIDNHGLVLARIPIEQWDSIPVSPMSVFGEEIWDFSCFPSVRTKSRVCFNYLNHFGFNLVGESEHWLRILRALMLYRIPRYSFSGRNRAYGYSVASTRNKFLGLIKFFQIFDLYQVNQIDGAPLRVLDDLTKETVRKYLMDRPTPAQRWDFASTLQYWQNLSRSGMLPPWYTVSEQFVSDEEASRLRREMDEAAAPFEPIPLDDFAELVSYAAFTVKECSKDLLWLAKTYYPTLIGKSQDREPSIADGLSLAEPDGVDAFRAYSPHLINGKPWWDLSVLQRSHPRDSGEYVSYWLVSAYVQSLLDCCTTIIFATTGMRRSEVAHLKVDCTETDQAGHWLRFTVFKTSVASQGDFKKIPIPQLTFDAIEVLRSLCAHSREFGQHNYLFSGISRAQFGKNPNVAFAERALNRVAEACGVSGRIHPHRFRKSLAMYIIYQDSKNIELIRHLFSHKSLRMTLRYIVALPGVNEELKRYLVEKNSEILAEVMSAAASGRIGGRGGRRVADNVADSKTFFARLQDRGKESLEQYVDSLLEAGIKLLHRSNLAICIRSPSVDDTVPCVGKHESAADRFHPNLFACDPFNCNFAVFTESHADALVGEVQFHERLLAHPYLGKEQADYSTRRVREANRRLDEVTGRADDSESAPRYG